MGKSAYAVLEENMAARKIRLTEEEWKTIDALASRHDQSRDEAHSFDGIVATHKLVYFSYPSTRLRVFA